MTICGWGGKPLSRFYSLKSARLWMRSRLIRKFSLVFLALFLFLTFSATMDARAESSTVPVRFEHIGPYGGDARSLLIDAQNSGNVYLGTSNGKIFKSSDAGKSWIPLYPGIGKFDFVVDTLVQHPSDPDHIYAGAWDLHSDGGGLFESRDAGNTWTRIVLPARSFAIRGLSICTRTPSHMIVGTLDGPYVSEDNGRNWKKVGGIDLQKAESVAIDPVDCHVLYVGTWRLGYKSSDFGKTWTLVDKGMPLDSDVFSISISIKNPEIIYSSACSGVYRSGNRAQSWTRLRLLPDRFAIRAQVVAIDPMDPHTVYSGTTEGLYVSNNDGQSWSRITSGDVTVNAIQVDPTNNRRILIGTEYQGVLLSENGGRSWKETNRGFTRKQISWILPDSEKPGNFIAGVLSGSGGLGYYNDRAGTWTLSQIEPGMRILSFLILPDNRGKLAGTSNGLYLQDGRSGRWTRLDGSIAKRTVYSLCLDPKNPIVYAGTDQGIYRAPLETLNFRIPPGYRFSPKAWCLTAPKSNPGVVYAGTSLGLLRSYDRGTTWSVISAYGLPERVAIENLAVSPLNKENLLAGTSVGLYESRSGGVYWNRIPDPKINGHILAILFLDDSGSRILAAEKTPGGLAYSKDAGESWDRIGSPRIESAVHCLTRDPEQPSRIYAGTESEGVYVLDFP
jgi:photosystem II stability/assembly factor-like uncharacterized protein